MQAITSIEKLTQDVSFEKIPGAGQIQHTVTPMVSGIHKNLIMTGIWINIFLCALYIKKNPLKAFRTLKELKEIRNNSRENHSLLKYAKVGRRYYYSFYAPGWPSQAFSKYISNNIKKLDNPFSQTTLDTILFAITKKCGYQCEHCFEWNALNKPETLDTKDLLLVIDSFEKLGITQVQLSGGEPLNRFDDIISILEHTKKATEVWLFTSGYHLTKERAALLKQHGLTGVSISLDHWIPALHNSFRGKKNAFEWVEKAVANARKEKLVVCLSLCATNEFINKKNLFQYAELAKNWGVSFIQVLEPKSVGHYAGKDVCLDQNKISLLEEFYATYNYNEAFVDYPSVVYHGFYSRRIGCGAGGKHYVYIDTDGDVHNCPFCQRKLFSALQQPLEKNIELMMARGCGFYTNS